MMEMSSSACSVAAASSRRFRSACCASPCSTASRAIRSGSTEKMVMAVERSLKSSSGPSGSACRNPKSNSGIRHRAEKTTHGRDGVSACCSVSGPASAEVGAWDAAHG